jgi:hypothetical protein
MSHRRLVLLHRWERDEKAGSREFVQFPVHLSLTFSTVCEGVVGSGKRREKEREREREREREMGCIGLTNRGYVLLVGQPLTARILC